MTKDYAKKNLNAQRQRAKSTTTHQPAQTSGVNGLLWAVAGFILGVGLTFFTLWKLDLNLSPNKGAVETTSPQAPIADITPKTSKPKPRFDFYTLLPNMSVDVPDVASPGDSPKQSQIAQRNQSDKFSEAALQYIIQAGSFKQHKQAEQLKASLALHGFESKIQTVDIEPNDTWYRVFIGPFPNQDIANNQQERLENTKALNSLVLKIRV